MQCPLICEGIDVCTHEVCEFKHDWCDDLSHYVSNDLPTPYEFSNHDAKQIKVKIELLYLENIKNCNKIHISNHRSFPSSPNFLKNDGEHKLSLSHEKPLILDFNFFRRLFERYFDFLNQHSIHFDQTQKTIDQTQKSQNYSDSLNLFSLNKEASKLLDNFYLQHRAIGSWLTDTQKKLFETNKDNYYFQLKNLKTLKNSISNSNSNSNSNVGEKKEKDVSEKKENEKEKDFGFIGDKRNQDRNDRSHYQKLKCRHIKNNTDFCFMRLNAIKSCSVCQNDQIRDLNLKNQDQNENEENEENEIKEKEEKYCDFDHDCKFLHEICLDFIRGQCNKKCDKIHYVQIVNEQMVALKTKPIGIKEWFILKNEYNYFERSSRLWDLIKKVTTQKNRPTDLTINTFVSFEIEELVFDLIKQENKQNLVGLPTWASITKIQTDIFLNGVKDDKNDKTNDKSNDKSKEQDKKNEKNAKSQIVNFLDRIFCEYLLYVNHPKTPNGPAAIIVALKDAIRSHLISLQNRDLHSCDQKENKNKNEKENENENETCFCDTENVEPLLLNFEKKLKTFIFYL